MEERHTDKGCMGGQGHDFPFNKSTNQMLVAWIIFLLLIKTHWTANTVTNIHMPATTCLLYLRTVDLTVQHGLGVLVQKALKLYRLQAIVRGRV